MYQKNMFGKWEFKRVGMGKGEGVLRDFLIPGGGGDFLKTHMHIRLNESVSTVIIMDTLRMN